MKPLAANRKNPARAVKAYRERVPMKIKTEKEGGVSDDIVSDEEMESALQDFVVDVYNFILNGGDEFRRMQLRMMHDNLRSMLLGMRDRFAKEHDGAGFQKAILRGGIVMGAYSMIKLSESEGVANVN